MMTFYVVKKNGKYYYKGSRYSSWVSSLENAKLYSDKRGPGQVIHHHGGRLVKIEFSGLSEEYVD